MTYALYYAGMANDLTTEQIGLALSPDGRTFNRVEDGLLVTVSADRPWKSLCTCNPTVIAVPGGYRIFYQGISAQQETCITTGRSTNGLTWDLDDEPILTVAMLAKPLETESRQITGLIEPSVLVDKDGFRMWFISRGANEPGNRLHHARSTDGETWQLDGVGLVTGQTFDPQRPIYYPQVVPHANGFFLYLSLRAKDGSFAVLRFDGWCEIVHQKFRRGPSRLRTH